MGVDIGPKCTSGLLKRGVPFLVVLALGSEPTISQAGQPSDPRETRARAACASIGLNAFAWAYDTPTDAKSDRLDATCGTIPEMPTRHVVASPTGFILIRPSESPTNVPTTSATTSQQATSTP